MKSPGIPREKQVCVVDKTAWTCWNLDEDLNSFSNGQFGELHQCE
jgi:hypothetical protein